MTEDNVHIHAVVAEAEEGEVLGRINLSGGVITSLERAGEFRTAIGATIPKKNFHRFKVWFHDYTKEPSSLTEGAA
jgi:hypothetical protein